MTRARIVGGLAALLAVLAGIGLILHRHLDPLLHGERPAADSGNPGPPPRPTDRDDLPRLPPHVINVAFGPIDLVADAGTDPHGPTVIVVSGDELEIIVRPERELEKKATVKAFWRKNQRVKRWHPPTEYGQHSTYRFRGPSERPFGRGPGKIVAVVSPIPDVPDEVPAAWLDSPPRHWQILQQSVRWK